MNVDPQIDVRRRITAEQWEALRASLLEQHKIAPLLSFMLSMVGILLKCVVGGATSRITCMV